MKKKNIMVKYSTILKAIEEELEKCRNNNNYVNNMINNNVNNFNTNNNKFYNNNNNLKNYVNNAKNYNFEKALTKESFGKELTKLSKSIDTFTKDVDEADKVVNQLGKHIDKVYDYDDLTADDKKAFEKSVKDMVGFKEAQFTGNKEAVFDNIDNINKMLRQGHSDKTFKDHKEYKQSVNRLEKPIGVIINNCKTIREMYDF